MKIPLSHLAGVAAALTLAGLLGPAALARRPAASGPPAPPSFTAEQAHRGAIEFYENCAECHGARSQGKYGPALVGADGNLQWETVQYVYQYATAQMPAGNAGGLPQRVYVNVMAYLLREHGNRPGKKPLTAAAANTSLALMERPVK